MISLILSQLLEKGINLVFALDTTKRKFLVDFNGKVVQLQFAELKTALFLVIRKEKIIVYHIYSDKPDTIIKGSGIAFLKQCLPTQIQNTLEIEGDIELAQQLQFLLQEINIDWEEYLSYVTGDVVANQVGNLWHKFKKSMVDITKRTTEDMLEYIQEEQRFLPTREEVEDFYEELAALRHQVDRLEARFGEKQ